MQAELAELNRLRMERDLTYAAMAAAIGLKPHTLYRLLTRRTRRPNERTEYKLRRWLEQQRTEAA